MSADHQIARGRFIVIEGIEGAGKTTQIPLLVSWLSGRGIPAIGTVEPGGTDIGRRIRSVILDPDLTAMRPVTELLLYNAARAQHVEEVILPALAAGTWVVCDRFSDSTLAYQGYGRGLDREMILALDRIATGGLRPDLSIVLDLDVETGLRRNMTAGKTDRMERESVEFHRRVQEGFRRIAEADDRVVRVSAEGGPGDVHGRITALVESRLCR